MSRYTQAVLLFLGSEAVFFLFLIIAYVNFHTTPQSRHQASLYLDVGRTAWFTAALLSSSLTAWRAEAARKKGKAGRAVLWLTLTVALGVTFLFGQATEYTGLISRNITVAQNLFGSTFFTLTGFHGIHVFLGVVMLAILLVLPLCSGGAPPPALGPVSIYWHFVDIVWVFIFGIVYLWSYWTGGGT